MRNPLDPFSKVLDEQSHWDPEWYSWMTDLSKTTTQLETELAAQKAINTSQQAAITALQSAPPGLVFIQSQTITSPVATVVFTGINATYDAYQFHVTGMKPSTDNANLLMQISVDGGASWLATNIWTWVYTYIGGGTAVFGHNSTAEGNTAYYRITGGVYAGWGCAAEILLYPGSANNLNMAIWRGLVYHPSTTTYQQIGSGTEQSDAAPCNVVRFFFSFGNIVTGRIGMYGIRKI